MRSEVEGKGPDWPGPEDAPLGTDESAPCGCRRIRWDDPFDGPAWMQVVHCPDHLEGLA